MSNSLKSSPDDLFKNGSIIKINLPSKYLDYVDHPAEFDGMYKAVIYDTESSYAHAQIVYADETLGPRIPIYNLIGKVTIVPEEEDAPVLAFLDGTGTHATGNLEIYHMHARFTLTYPDDTVKYLDYQRHENEITLTLYESEDDEEGTPVTETVNGDSPRAVTDGDQGTLDVVFDLGSYGSVNATVNVATAK